jgi:hypothetical protein
LKATCSLEWCDIRVEVGLEEKWDAGICQGMGSKTEINPLTILCKEVLMVGRI